jgi:hypothetical protein
VIILFLCAFCCESCLKHTTEVHNDAARSANMGFTYFPYDGNSTGVQFALEVIAHSGDMFVAHFDNGIPWDTALTDNFSQYPQDFQNEIDSILLFNTDQQPKRFTDSILERHMNV